MKEGQHHRNKTADWSELSRIHYPSRILTPTKFRRLTEEAGLGVKREKKYFIENKTTGWVDLDCITFILENGIGGETYAWNVLIPKASFAIQMKLAQQNKLLARIANSNAELEMKKFQREIKNKKYM